MLILAMVPVTQPPWLLHSLAPVQQENGTSRLLKYHAQQPTRKFLCLKSLNSYISVFHNFNAGKVSQIHKTYLLDQQLLCWRHFTKTEVVQNTDLNILALYQPKLFCQ